jgi:hypothetical protein
VVSEQYSAHSYGKKRKAEIVTSAHLLMPNVLGKGRCAASSRSVPLDRRVCAQHGRDVMGWKSPVGVPTWIHDEDMITTSRRQGQDREGLSGGSRSANVRGDGQKLHRRLRGPRRAGT